MIHVVVVESHNHALEHIHKALRQSRLLNHDWSMLHIDAHADLACPGPHIPAISCYRPHMEINTDNSSNINVCDCRDITGIGEEIPLDDANLNDNDDTLKSVDGRNLYELLDATSSGIAEWILPLVLAAKLRSICWVRNPNTIPLIPTGTHRYQVGVYVKSDTNAAALITKPNNLTSFLDLPLTASVKVDWNCRYYLEDSSYVPSRDLLFSQSLLLTVKEGPDVECDASIPSLSESIVNCTVSDDVYAMDICLDYFLCYNPFLKDLELHSPKFAKALYDAVIQSKFYSNSYNNGAQSTVNFAVELFIYHRQFAKFLESLMPAQLYEDFVSALLPFYDNSQNVVELLDQIQSAFSEFNGTLEERNELITMSVEALPYMTMPHTTLRSDEIDESLIQQRLQYMRKEILEYSQLETRPDHTPFIITIARSTEDGFTPCYVVDSLQDRVLNEIHTMFCGCSNRIQPKPSSFCREKYRGPSLHEIEGCRCTFVFDY